MRSLINFFCSLTLAVLLVSACHGATITGTVKDPEGSPFRAAFVEAQNAKTRINVIVLSDSKGNYRIDNLAAGEYRLQIRAVGYRAEPRPGVNLTASQNATFDFALQKGTIRWSDVTFDQAMRLWPADKGKDILNVDCSACHLFQTRIASTIRDKEGWRDRIEYMREAMHYALGRRFTDQKADDLASYLATLFGPDSVLPKSPADMPGYKETVRPTSNMATNIVFVEYEMPGPNRMPFSAAPDKNGNIWIPNFGAANKITRLDPDTGKMQDFPVPHVGTAGIHSAIPAADGSVWFTEQGANKLGRWDPQTEKITEFQDRPDKDRPGKEGTGDAEGEGGSKHTVRVDANGYAWASGSPLTRLDPKTGKYTHFDEVPTAYDVKTAPNGDVWFSTFAGGKIGKVDGKTLKVTQWNAPTPKGAPRRMVFGSDGIVWVGESRGGKMARFDPETETFKEFTLPGHDPSPYSMGFDAKGYLWYNSFHQDTLDRFDINTGEVIEFPVPHSEISMRELFLDSKGRMWYGSPSNNKVGYFYLTGQPGSTTSASK